MTEQSSLPGGKPTAPRLPKLSFALKRSAEIEYFRPGALLVRQGETPARLFLIASGNVRVLLGTGADARVIARLGAGAWIGETALLTGSVSSTSVVAEDEVRVFAVSQRDFLAAAEADPAIFREVARELAERLRSADALIDSGPAHRVVALRHGPGHEAHARAIAAACAVWSPLPHLTVALAADSTGRTSIAEYARDPARLLALQAELRAKNSATVPGAGADPDEIALFLRGAAEFTGLVLLYGERASEAAGDRLTEIASLGTARGLAARSTEPYHVPHERIVVDERFDAHRVARWICRRRIGLVLGGGGARGFAHIGALRAIAGAGIPVDVVTGTSIGAAVAAGIASGRSVASVGDAIAAAGRGAMIPSLLPIHSVFNSMFVEREVRQQFGESTFSELTLPLGIVAVDLLSGDEIVFTSGRVTSAVMASMAVPGMFAPVRHEGRLLVDGALRSPLPVRACRQLGGDIIVASHMRVAPAEATVSSPRLPWMAETMVRALDIMQDNIAAESLGSADIRIETVIPRQQGGLFDFGHRLAVEAAGERAAVTALDGLTLETLRDLPRRSERRSIDRKRAA
jgi:NTE family protein